MSSRSLASRIASHIFSRVNWRVGGRGQVRTNKGFKPQQLQSLGNALFFARWSKHLRAATVGEFVKKNVSPAAAAEIKNPGVYVRRIESGEILPSPECRKQLEKIVGVRIAPERRRKRPKL